MMSGPTLPLIGNAGNAHHMTRVKAMAASLLRPTPKALWESAGRRFSPLALSFSACDGDVQGSVEFFYTFTAQQAVACGSVAPTPGNL